MRLAADITTDAAWTSSNRGGQRFEGRVDRSQSVDVQRTYGKAVRDFPHCFFSGSTSEWWLLLSGGYSPRARNVTDRRPLHIPPPLPTRTPHQDGAFAEAVSGTGVAAVLPVVLLTVPAAFSALATFFSHITVKDIRQESGRTLNNAGELLPQSVAAMLTALGPLGEHDVFMDVGAGIGNVLAQVALTTKVGRCLGIEVRNELCSIAEKHLRRHAAAQWVHIS
ncbi:unnamed protein product [Phytophthora fragariaefolia]|uniref:Histone-lysine N-methyltransferase, H3 lysine-79 specific n=1 Tax=Phytophthora fragariaefolia TaxID=1490495 RepID=A0A9W6Y730_9STRA|nr:unnamed protein product [Phytophthora fragariaefolia]